MSYVYLAHPIDLAGTVAPIVHDAKAKLSAARVTYFSPADAWRGGGLPDGIQAVNEHALMRSRVVLAIVTGQPSLGLPAEMQMARIAGIPVVVWTTPEIKARSAALQTLAPLGVFTDLDDAIREAVMAPPRKPSGFCGQITREDAAKIYPLPTQAKEGDVGLDLYVSDAVAIPSHEWRGIPSRVAVAPPSSIWFMIIGRSSALHKRGLMVVPSVIDSGFRGVLFAMAYNITQSQVVIQRGERIAQLVPMPVMPFRFVETETLPASERGADGFGSTGA